MVNPFDRLIAVEFKESIPISIRLSSLKFPCVYTQSYAMKRDMLILLSSQILIKHLVEGFKDFFKDFKHPDTPKAHGDSK